MLCRRRLLSRPLFPFFIQEITSTSTKQQQQQNRVRLSTLCDTKTTVPKKILTHVKADQIEQAHELISQLPNKYATYQAYNQLIKAHARHVQDPIRQRKASSLVQEMKDIGLTPSNQTYFQLLIGAGSPDMLLPWFYEFMRLEGLKGYKKTAIKFKRIIAAVASSRGGHSGEQLKQMLMYTEQQQCFDIDKETWTTAIIGLSLSNELGMAEELLNYARQQGKAEVDGYGVLIQSYLNSTRQDLKSASQIFSNMSKDGLDATPSIYIAFLRTYINEPITKEDDCLLRIETVRRLWQAMMISATTTTTLIDEDEERIKMIKKKTKKRNNDDDHVPITLVTQILEYYRRHGALSDAEQVYLDTTKKLKIKLDRNCLGEMNKLILSFTRRKGCIPSVLSLYYDVLGLGHKPSMCVMQEIIKLLCLKGHKDAAYQLIQITTETLNDYNYTLDTSALERLIHETGSLN